MSKIKVLDLFAGCGGLTEGFLQTGNIDEVASVEWKEPQVKTLRNRLKTKWGISHADSSVLLQDIQQEDELFYGTPSQKGLDSLVAERDGVDMIIGGPPCQAYSIAGRVRDENGMKDDYRNFLFEHYLSIVDRYKPDVFVFENVPGLLSAKPTGTPVVDIITERFREKGYIITLNLKQAIVNAADFGVPQNRKRVIIIGCSATAFKNIDIQEALNEFYSEILPRQKVEKLITVKDAIGDLPKCIPFYDVEHHSRRKSHSTPECDITWHTPRYNNLRDMDTFKTLALDVETGRREYDSKKIAQLYEEKVGSSSPIHRYHVLEPNLPSTTIIAHLYKDGNRFIHYDSTQARTITPREAARLQSFPDDFVFIGSQGNAYEMIGNAVPPKLAYAIAKSIIVFLKKYLPKKYANL